MTGRGHDKGVWCNALALGRLSGPRTGPLIASCMVDLQPFRLPRRCLRPASEIAIECDHNGYYPKFADFRAALEDFFAHIGGWKEDLKSLLTPKFHFIGAPASGIP